MSMLRKIKGKINTIESYLRSNAAMKSVASVRITKFKKKLQILDQLLSLFKQEPENNPVICSQKIVLHIFIGCNQGMCGPFLSKIANYLKVKIKNMPSSDYYYILGEKFLEYGAHARIKTHKILCDLELCSVAENMYEFLINTKVTDVMFHYCVKDKMIEELFMVNRDVEKEYDIHELILFTIHVAHAVYQSGFFENKERILALEQANNNAKGLYKKLYTALNRVRQDSITNDLAEIVAGVLS